MSCPEIIDSPEISDAEKTDDPEKTGELEIMGSGIARYPGTSGDTGNPGDARDSAGHHQHHLTSVSGCPECEADAEAETVLLASDAISYLDAEAGWSY